MAKKVLFAVHDWGLGHATRSLLLIRALLERGDHVTVLMAEQNFAQAIRIADRGYVIVHGKIAFHGASADELNNNDLIRKFYLGL